MPMPAQLRSLRHGKGNISESVFCIASGLYAKSQFDWAKETPQTHRWVCGTFSLHGRLHSEAQSRLDASGFQSPTMSAPRGAAKKARIHQNSSCKQLRKSIINSQNFKPIMEINAVFYGFF